MFMALQGDVRVINSYPSKIGALEHNNTSIIINQSLALYQNT